MRGLDKVFHRRGVLRGGAGWVTTGDLGAGLASAPTHDDETVMNGAPGPYEDGLVCCLTTSIGIR